jgi:CSLREA domain-containing protein
MQATEECAMFERGNSKMWLAAGLAVLAAVTGSEARAAVFVATKSADTADGSCDRDCSLREAVIAANAAPGQDVIILPPGIYPLALAAGGADDPAVGDLDFTGNAVLFGQSAATTVVQAGGIDRVLDVPSGVALEVVGVSLAGGRASEGGGAVRNKGALSLTRTRILDSSAVGANATGGGIWSVGAGSSLSIIESTLSNNTASGPGGGIAVGEELVMVNSTVSGNASGDLGGGLYVLKNTDAAITQSTITANSAPTGGGIYGVSDPFISTARAHLAGSIVARNSGASDPDCSGSVGSDGGNLLGQGDFCVDFTPAKHDLEGTHAAPLDPKLGLLGANGGTTPTHALLAGSPAIDQLPTCVPVDQRGQTRGAAACDIGAFEVGDDCLDGGPNLCLNQDRFRVAAHFRTGQGATGQGQALPLTSDSGLYWFFDPANIELTVKVLDGCGLNGHYWVFLSGLTNVEVTITVTDTRNGTVKTYTNPLNRNFRPVFDTGAFATCS